MVYTLRVFFLFKMQFV